MKIEGEMLIVEVEGTHSEMRGTQINAKSVQLRKVGDASVVIESLKFSSSNYADWTLLTKALKDGQPIKFSMEIPNG